MDDLFQNAPEIKAIHDNFFDRLKTFESEEDKKASSEAVDAIIDDYLNNFESDELPESLKQALYIGEKPFTLPPEDQIHDAIKQKADRLVRVELAELAQDKELLSIVNGFEDANAEFQYDDQDWEQFERIHAHIQASLKKEMASTNPDIADMKDEELDLVEPKNKKMIARNIAIAKQFSKKVERIRAGAELPPLDLKDTFVTAYKPEIDPLSFALGLAAKNVFDISIYPIVNDDGEITSMEEVWEQSLDPVELATLMKHDCSDISTVHHMSGNGLEAPLDIDKKETALPVEDDVDERKYTEFQVLLELDENESSTTGSWPHIVERPNPAYKAVEEQEPCLSSPTCPTDILLHPSDLSSPTRSSNSASAADEKTSEDVTEFLKKNGKSSSEINPAAIKEKVKPLPVKKLTKFIPKSNDVFGYAEMLDADSNVFEYQTIKDHLARTYDFELDPFQQQAIVAMENGNSVFVAAHTSAGKTVVAEYAIALCRKNKSRCVYTSPIKALSNQKYRDFRNQFEDVGLITGDIQINEDASCLIMTTEILKSMLYNGRVSPDELEWVIFDEVHYINDIERGHVWEEVLIMLPHQVKIVMLSATVPNCLEFADWVGRIKNRKIYVVQTLVRPVPLVHHVYFGKDRESRHCCYEIMGTDGEFNFPSYNRAKRDQAALYIKDGMENNSKETCSNSAQDRHHYLTLIYFLRQENLLPAVDFIFSRKRCNIYARIPYGIDLTTAKEKEAIKEIFAKCINTLKDEDQKIQQIQFVEQLCLRGFAIHHSGVLPILKELVEILFQRGLVKFLFATETFAMGVNMPARTVIFDSLEKFDGKARRSLNCTEYIQMAGRAGRRGIDQSGCVMILAKSSDGYDYQELLPMLKGEAVSLESKFRITYNMLLNIIRAEQLNIEDMLQRSYVESFSLRNLSTKNEKISEILEKIKALPVLTCSDCIEEVEGAGGSAEVYYTSTIEYIKRHGLLMKKLVATNDEKICPGRFLLICYPQKNIPCMLVCVQSFVNTEETKELNVFGFETAGRRATDVGYDLLPEDERAQVKENLLFEHFIKYGGLEKLADYGQSCDKLEFIRNVPFENILGISCYKIKNMDTHAISIYFQDRIGLNNPARAPSYFVSKLMTGMDSIVKAHIQKPEDDFLFKIGVELSSNEDGFAAEISQYHQLQKDLFDDNKFPCRKCLDFIAHILRIRDRKLLESEYAKLKYQTSFNALVMTDDYMNCLNVLRELNFIDKENLLTLKGRVAAQINEDTLLITELIFENKFHNRGPSEVAAMLCTLTAQHRSSRNEHSEQLCKVKTKSVSSDVINFLKDDMAAMAHKLNVIESKCNVVNARSEDLTYGLMEAVYMWAEGGSFESITRLTDAHEGIIVRCIQRLEEILKDIKKAGRIIGDHTLTQKMVETSAAIRRDIIFAPSLYTLDN